MPQIQPGQVQQPGVDGAPKLYGVDKVENTIPFQERMIRLFKAHEFVTVKNIDDEPIYWQYMPQEAEEINSTDDGLQQIVTRDAPEMWVINPGETEVLIGASAYRCLDVMYKNVTAKKTLRRFKDPNKQVYDETGQHQPRNFNFADGGAQEDFLKQAYLGKAQLAFAPQTPVMPTVAPVAAAPAAPAVQQQPVDEVPQPRVPEGAPLAPVAYAEPDAPAPSAKDLIATSDEKKVVQPKQ